MQPLHLGDGQYYGSKLKHSTVQKAKLFCLPHLTPALAEQATSIQSLQAISSCSSALAQIWTYHTHIHVLTIVIPPHTINCGTQCKYSQNLPLIGEVMLQYKGTNTVHCSIVHSALPVNITIGYLKLSAIIYNNNWTVHTLLQRRTPVEICMRPVHHLHLNLYLQLHVLSTLAQRQQQNCPKLQQPEVRVHSFM